jgi:hypothetical protein
MSLLKISEMEENAYQLSQRELEVANASAVRHVMRHID